MNSSSLTQFRRLVFDVDAWVRNGGDDNYKNRTFWKVATILRMEDPIARTVTVQFCDDGRISKGHFFDSTRPDD